MFIRGRGAESVGDAPPMAFTPLLLPGRTERVGEVDQFVAVLRFSLLDPQVLMRHAASFLALPLASLDHQMCCPHPVPG